MKKEKKNRIRILVECALLISIGTVLGLIPVAELPYGGSITFASVLPIIIISYRHGLLWGMGAGTAFAVLQQLLGLKNLFYVTTWQSVVAVIMLDYLIAYSVAGLGGIYRKPIKNQSAAMVCGALTVSLLRYICHVVSGATVWAGISIPTKAAMIYSIAYNAAFMIPETLILTVAAFYLGSVLDFRKAVPSLIEDKGNDRVANILTIISGFIGVTAITVDTVMIFLHAQNEDAILDLGLLKTDDILNSFWLYVIIITLIAAVMISILLIASSCRRRKHKAKNAD